MKPLFSVLLLCLLSTGTVFSQKIKYKDLFVLLDARRFDEAEPFLRKYLKEHQDNPNAFLFMGFLLEAKVTKSDILKSPDFKTIADSSIFWFGKAKAGITEKEIKRNDEFYQFYGRRDLRTGEFEIRLSDIQIDIDKRTNALNKLTQDINLLRSQFMRVEDLYHSSHGVFRLLQQAFPGEKELLLRSDEKTIEQLKLVHDRYDSMVAMFNAYKATLGLFSKPGYNQSLKERQIAKFEDDGGGTPDFYADEIKVWAFNEWAVQALKMIQSEVQPLREKLVAYDVEVNKMIDKVRKDSVSVTAQIPAFYEKLQVNPVAKYDPSPMPLQLVKMKVEELKYSSMHIDNRRLRDSSSYVVRIQALRKEIATLARVDSLAGLLEKMDFDKESVNYQHFVTNAFGTTKVITSLVKATRDFAVHERMKKSAAVDKYSKSLNWIVIENDSVPLSMEKSEKYNHVPLFVASEKFISGMKYGPDSLATGFFYTITPNRVPDLRASFAVDKASFSRSNLPVLKGLCSGDDKGQVFYTLVYSETKLENLFPVTIARITRSEGLTWTTNYKFEYAPTELIVSPATGDVSVKITSPSGDSKLVNIDKTGKQL